MEGQQQKLTYLKIEKCQANKNKTKCNYKTFKALEMFAKHHFYFSYFHMKNKTVILPNLEYHWCNLLILSELFLYIYYNMKLVSSVHINISLTK